MKTMLKLIGLSVVLALVSGTAHAADEPMVSPRVKESIAAAIAQDTGAIMSLVGRTDASGNLLIVSAAVGAVADTRAIGSLVGRTDASGNLVVAFDSAAASSVLPTFVAFGGTTSSFPALVRNSTALDVKLADNSAYTTLNASSVAIQSGGEFRANGRSFIVATAPSAPSSCGTSPSVSAGVHTAAFVVTGGTGGTATGCTVTMPAATTGWVCHVVNITQTDANRADRTTVQTASTTTSVTFEYQTVSTGAATAFTASDVFRGMCFAY